MGDDRPHILCLEVLVLLLPVMDGFAVDFVELGDPFLYVSALGVELLALEFGVEYSEIGLGVIPCGCHPLPVPIVLRGVIVHQIMREVLLPFLPTDQQILHQITRHDHPQPVMHHPCQLQLSHRRIHNRDPSHPILPTLQMLLIPHPLDIIVLLQQAIEAFLRHHRVVVELSPKERSPDLLLFAAVVELTDADGAEFVVGGEVGVVGVYVVPVLLVVFGEVL